MKLKAERREAKKQSKKRMWIKKDHVGTHDELSRTMKKHIKKHKDRFYD